MMKLNHWTLFTLFFVLNCYSTCAVATDLSVDICKALKREKKPSIYLVDKGGNLSKGPVHFGVYSYTFQRRDFILIPTEFRVVIYPARVELSGSGEGIMGVTAVLKPSKALCADSKTYSVSFSTREAKSDNVLDAFSLPWKEDTDFVITRATDPKLELGDFLLEYRFDARFVGTIIDGSKVQK